MSTIAQKPRQVIVKPIGESGVFPNNGKLPLVIYAAALNLPKDGAPDRIDQLVRSNRWGGTWRWSLYTYHHYHSTAHECLCIFRGSVRVQFGGAKGEILTAEAGDVLILPAGLAHKNVRCSADFQTLGCYPAGQSPDMQFGKSGERPAADHAIARVPLPQFDPIFGTSGRLSKLWS